MEGCEAPATIGTFSDRAVAGHSEVDNGGDDNGEDKEVDGVVDKDLSYYRVVLCVLKKKGS